MAKRFTMTPFDAIDKYIDIDGANLNIRVDYDDVDHETVEKEATKLLRVLNEHWDEQPNADVKAITEKVLDYVYSGIPVGRNTAFDKVATIIGSWLSIQTARSQQLLAEILGYCIDVETLKDLTPEEAYKTRPAPFRRTPRVADVLRWHEGAPQQEGFIIYPFHTAPQELRKLSTNGGDEDWLIIVPSQEMDTDHHRSWLLSQPIFSDCDKPERHPLPDGRVIYITSH